RSWLPESARSRMIFEGVNRSPSKLIRRLIFCAGKSVWPAWASRVRRTERRGPGGGTGSDFLKKLARRQWRKAGERGGWVGRAWPAGGRVGQGWPLSEWNGVAERAW